ncbi:MAG: indolepyruvate ferredoxin oxidoreductase subunit alpha [Candidatus Omnitrophica bacterium]|nr:indolepyruvate ferredoxin oxidoreductase subunit alpha [Candidatus Omnitrophota bacterium]MCM8776932.1 indolepyruvate ferredoxin oxidoreductase subunit alpha [Candidatus Omnitrophota bacterium]
MYKKYLLGNEAIAYGLVEGNIEASFAYPGTPSSEITEKLIELSRIYGFYVEWSINEKVAYENAYGVSLTGRRAAVIMKHVGLNVASDAFITSAYTGVIGGLVIIIADDPYAHSSQNEQDSRRYAVMAKIPCLEPSSIQEAKDMVSFAFSLSERAGLPVLVRSVTRLSHSRADVVLQDIKYSKRDTSFKKTPERFVMVPANARKSLKILNEKQKDIKEYVEELLWNEAEDTSLEIGIITAGISFQYTKEIKENHNLPFALFKVSSLPLPYKKITSFIKNKKKLFIFEEGDPVIEEQVYLIAKSINPSIEIIGKISGEVQTEGEMSVEVIDMVLNGKSPQKPFHSLPKRMPVLCPGCPHSGSFYILKKVFGKDAIFPGDIGCYTLGILSGTIDTCLCMGAGIGTGSGIARFEKQRPVLSIIGDSTFFHAGIPELINACYNSANQVIVILDNRTTAMTGHQPHPGVGITASGEKTIDINIEKLASICGAEKVVVIDPYRIKESIKILKEIKDMKGVRVIVAKRPCIFVEKQDGTKFKVDSEKCKGCKLCLEIMCPAICLTNGKAEISVYCNGCGICEEICPYGAIKKDE